jgi:hypothetical protein
MSENFSTTRRPAAVASNIFAVLVSALLGGLAGGAAWCFLSLWLPWFATLWIVPIGIALAAFARWQDYRGGAAIVCTVLAIAIAFVYAQYLFGAVRIADAMGLPLREALFKAGFELTADIALSNLRIADAIALTIALLAGAAVANFGVRSRRSSEGRP